MLPSIQFKTIIPENSEKTVNRKRLIDHIDNSLNNSTKLFLVAAPAGYGKTTLISEWISLQGKSIVWLTLDEEDNDLRKFIAGIILSFNSLNKNYFKNTRNLFDLPKFIGNNSILSSFFNELSQINKEIVLVLDDYHYIENKEVNEIFKKTLKYLPSNILIVMLTREDPQLSLNKLRIEEELFELRAKDLKFNEKEVLRLYDLLNIKIEKEDLILLSERTEGWISGLKLVGIKLLGKDNEDIHNFIEKFSGSNYYIMDYLVEEVLGDIEEDLKEFLIITSVVDRINPSLCNYLTGRNDSLKIFKKLVKMNIFITELDSNQHWFRYHKLFKDLLNFHLEKDIKKDLHKKASLWYIKNSLPQESVKEALKSGDFKLAVKHIDEAIPTLLQEGKIKEILELLEDIPDRYIADNLTILIIKAWAFFAVGKKKDALYYINLINRNETLMDDKNKGRLYTLTALIPEFNNHNNPTLMAQQALDLLDKDDYIFKINGLMTLGQIQSTIGDLENSIKSFRKAYYLGREHDQLFLEIISLINLVLKMNQQGNLQEAFILCEQNIERHKDEKGKLNPLGQLICIPEGILLYYKGKYDKAKESLLKGIEISEQLNLVHVAWMPKLYYAKSCFEKGENAKAIDIIEELLIYTKKYNLKPNHDWAKIIQEEFEIKTGKYDINENFENRYLKIIESKNHYLYSNYFFNYCIYLIYIEDNIKVLNLLENMGDQVYDNLNYIEKLQYNILFALTHFKMNNHLISREYLSTTISYLGNENYLSIFITYGKYILPLINQNIDLAPKYFNQIKKKIENQYTSKKDKKMDNLIEPLTDREIEILKLTAEGFTNKKIAEELYITIGTTKWHLSNIYSKLGVKNRTKATIKGRKIGIIK